MTLAGMVNLSEDALICDFAETYHIYDYTALPLQTAAVLAAGLRDDSRIKLLASGAPTDQKSILLAAIADRVEAFRWMFIKSGGTKQPVSLLGMLMGDHKKTSGKYETFDSPDALLAALKEKQQEAT